MSTLTIAAHASTASMGITVADTLSLGTAAYTSDFSAGVNSWLAKGIPQPSLSASGGRLNISIGAVTLVSPRIERSISGLTVGKMYRVITTGRNVLDGAAFPRVAMALASDTSARTSMMLGTLASSASHTFIATGTTEVLQMHIERGGTNAPAPMDFTIDKVRVHLVPTGYSTPVLQRIDRNGAHVVANIPDPVSGGFTFEDSAPALAGAVTYLLTDWSGEETTNTHPGFTTIRNPILHAPNDYSIDARVLHSVTLYGESRGMSSTAHQIIGRDTPVVVTGPLRSRNGSFTLHCESFAEARAILDAYDSGTPLLLRQADFPGMDMYHIANDVRVDPYAEASALNGRMWSLTVNYIETAW